MNLPGKGNSKRCPGVFSNKDKGRLFFADDGENDDNYDNGDNNNNDNGITMFSSKGSFFFADGGENDDSDDNDNVDNGTNQAVVAQCGSLFNLNFIIV